PSEINRVFGGLSTRKWQCTYPTRQVGDGRARFEGSCQDRKGRRINVRLNGTYEEQAFRFNGGAQLARGTPYIPASITARRLAAQCPAGAEYFSSAQKAQRSGCMSRPLFSSQPVGCSGAWRPDNRPLAHVTRPPFSAA